MKNEICRMWPNGEYFYSFIRDTETTTTTAAQLRKQQQESLTIFERLFKRFGASSPQNERFKWFWANWFKLVRSWAWQGIYLFLFGCVFFSSSALRNDPLNMFATLFHCDYVTFICSQLALETTLGPLMSSVSAIITTNLLTYIHALAYI